MTFHDETTQWIPRDREAIWVTLWDYFEPNEAHGGGGGHEWAYDKTSGLDLFAWAVKGWSSDRCTIRLVRIDAPAGMVWTTDQEAITTAVMAASDLLEEPSKYPPHFTLIAECKWNGGAS